MTTILSKKLYATLLAGALAAAACGGDEPKNQPKAELEQPAPGYELPSAIADDDRDMTSRTPEPAKVDLPAAAEPARSEPVPETYAEHLALGKQAAEGGDVDRAVEILEKAAEMRPKAASPRIELARAYLDAGKAAEARGHAESAVELAPDSSYAWNTLGRVELMEGDHEAAATSFQRAVEENEDNSYAWNNLGLTLMTLDRWPEAAEALERATSGASPTSYMWNNLGMAYEHVDELDLARAAYRQAADAGSGKASASLERLEGVVSLETSDLPEPTVDLEPELGPADLIEPSDLGIQ